MRRALCVLLVVSVSATPVWADVLPVKRGAKNGNDRAKVAERLREVGLPAAEATDHAARLTSQDAAYFAADMERVQVVGTQDYMFTGEASPSTWEIIIGAGVGLATLGGLRLMTRNNEH